MANGEYLTNGALATNQPQYIFLDIKYQYIQYVQMHNSSCFLCGFWSFHIKNNTILQQNRNFIPTDCAIFPFANLQPWLVFASTVPSQVSNWMEQVTLMSQNLHTSFLYKNKRKILFSSNIYNISFSKKNSAETINKAFDIFKSELLLVKKNIIFKVT